MNFRLINSILSRVIMLQGILLLPSCLVGILYHEWHDVLVYLIVSICCTLFGLLLYQVKPKSSTFYAREGFVAVSLSWIIMSVIGAMPFYFSSDIPDFTDALFEIISGFTTTGSSILLDVEALSHANLFWRSFSHWIGGMGVLVFILAILPMSGGSTMNLMKAESPGPSVGKLVPRIQQTAFLLYAIYFAMTIIELILLLCGSMRPFDALCLTLGTAGTGGFGIRNDSLASYSTYSQIVVTVFMFLFGVNFTFYYFFQVAGWKSINIGKISSLPASISNIRIYLEKTEKDAKLPVGPTISRPGPILLSVAATEVKVVVKSNPSRLIRRIDTINTTP